jgi:hypothetical protein
VAGFSRAATERRARRRTSGPVLPCRERPLAREPNAWRADVKSARAALSARAPSSDARRAPPASGP